MTADQWIAILFGTIFSGTLLTIIAMVGSVQRKQNRATLLIEGDEKAGVRGLIGDRESDRNHIDEIESSCRMRHPDGSNGDTRPMTAADIDRLIKAVNIRQGQ